MPELDVTREPQQRNRRAAAPMLKLVDVAFDEASAARSFECRIGRELHDVGLACHSRPHSAAAKHPGCVNDVHLARLVMNEPCAAKVPNADAMVPRHRMNRIRPRGRRRVCRRHDLDLVAAIAQELRDVGRVARRPADVGGPDPGNDQHFHGSKTASG
jgi:hypothetical protein